MEVKKLNPPRPGKKCLVLDIDYTLFDLVRALGCVSQSAFSTKLALCWQPASVCSTSYAFLCTVPYLGQELAFLGSLFLARVRGKAWELALPPAQERRVFLEFGFFMQPVSGVKGIGEAHFVGSQAAV